MTDTCPKCLSTDLAVKYYAKGEVITAQGRSRLETEFVTSSQFEFYYRYNAAKEHLAKSCRRCQYKWHENTADAK